MKTLPLIALLFFGLTSCQAPSSGSDWTTIWSDASSASEWRMAGPGEFVVEGDTLYAQGGMGLYWYAEREFKDFTLELEWKVTDASNNSGVFVRFPDPGNDPWIAVNQGYELQICDTADDKHNTGSVYSFQGPSAVPTKPVGEWNRYTITVVGQLYTISVNGQKVNQYTGDRTLKGYIGLQNHDDGSPVRYRNIRVRAL
jgi:3-keto-disaccharide hydrolase